MHVFRKRMSDGFCGGPLAAVIAMLLSLQALIGGFGTGAMAVAANAPFVDAVICTGNGIDHGHAHMGDHADGGSASVGGAGRSPHETHAKDCCLTACQIAAAVHLGIPARPPQPSAQSADASVEMAAVAVRLVSPRGLGLSRDARGPPAASI